MSRSAWKSFFLHSSIIKKSKSINRVWARNSAIPQNLLNARVSIHNGKSFRQIILNEGMLGLKFGEFAPTRKKRKNKSIFKIKKK